MRGSKISAMMLNMSSTSRLLQDELSAVEQELGCDISLLMDKIDECNRKLLDAQ